MTRKCFFLDQVDPGQEYVILSDQAAHHMESVLRLKAGDRVELCDGRGNAWHGVIEKVDPETIRVRLAGRRDLEKESPLELTLALAFARSDRMELVLRQATEMGVNRFFAFRAQRSQYGLSGNQKIKREERWQKIAREAMCQCQRTRLPQIQVVESISEFLDRTAPEVGSDDDSLRVLASEEEREQSLITLWHLFPKCGKILAVVGPEGGWTETEESQFTEAGFKTVHLGPRILRLETAAIALLASAQLLWGDFK